MVKTYRVLTIFILFLVVGCAHMRNPEEPKMSLVYGYIDMREAPSDADEIIIRQYQNKPADEDPYQTAEAVSGMFWFDQLMPGSYQLIGFSGETAWLRPRSWFASKYEYHMPEREQNDSLIKLITPGIYFMGSFYYKNTGSFFNPQFDIQKVDAPTEKELLKQLLPYSSGTKWEAMIQKRISELK